ncbi:hypothetical protein BV25DRAFT_1828534 [Artomyces pyxidatus]|uniref:Uncharacterized protein n=1 Tax=Artomyces pyxidatus TaxID=48021 RepID=A0ACB8STJ6_9AGAM|nr:hypothetical protein BV25DRAFT_1828534 [Artomyces pyxidatus]
MPAAENESLGSCVLLPPPSLFVLACPAALVLRAVHWRRSTRCTAIRPRRPRGGTIMICSAALRTEAGFRKQKGVAEHWTGLC